MSQPARILLVDDDLSLLRLLSLRLEAAGFEVMPVENGELALGSLPGFRPDLLITDLRMDGMDGMALFEQVHRRHPFLPVIILTAHGTIPEAVQATKKGVFSFVTKPFESRELLEQIQQALEQSRLSESMSGCGNDQQWRAGIITRNAAMEELLSRAYRVAGGDASVFIEGESGTGKELLAKAIHRASPRAEGPFIAVNCGAIPENLLESELFGHRRGAFTGAVQDHQGLFVSASGGTLFLDEIGDMPMPLQVKLLRVLQEREVRPVGATRPIPVDVRIISATHRNLEEEMKSSRFREDLYYRLNVVTLSLPPLNHRRDDIPLLAEYFRESLAQRYQKSITGFSRSAMELLMTADWTGNVRQLYNVVEQAVALSPAPQIQVGLLQDAIKDRADDIIPFADARRQFELDYLIGLLQMTRGNVTQAARLAGRNRTEFYKLLHRHALDPAQFKD
ncbi:sigma 54-interacting transcriptional regulator [Candidatus Macondimonas diazotrophica]|jgi:two-component system response regulator GlrR|uniref:Response regulator n=1 Tax=Candidatus Macondimonas diazotrophica TaxID=2305248 RepID=A0A4Z0F7P2_9GAMM|nr:sigma 54-interacting transcriptional regulator [Candidatus Macondimonas diazotrophica]NCU01707.1 response regulator [Candidatus Macondimonas diazotrophica]TFZ82331.1 response regulator [Candidatus Macondimonas diazotrophica]HBG31128.1 two-component system response regulator GlrR [Gammaproteobacteria bacterium]